MTRLSSESLCYYDHSVTDLIIEKYGYSRLDALRKFVESDTHKLLEDVDNGLNSIGENGIFDIWENEIVTGNPYNSIYIRGQ